MNETVNRYFAAFDAGIGHPVFDLREAHARVRGFSQAAFCAVIRSDDHPLRIPDTGLLMSSGC